MVIKDKIMDIDLARHFIRSMMKASTEMTSLIPVLKENCSEDEYEYYGKTLAKISASISLDVINDIFSKFPELKEEVDEQITKYSRY